MIILCLDGLEYDLAIHYKYLKQRYQGKLAVPIDQHYGVPRSPSVWYSFLTGTWNTTLDFQKQKSIQILKWIRKLIPLSLGLGKRIQKTNSFKKINLPQNFVTDAWQVYNMPYINIAEAPMQIVTMGIKQNLNLWQIANNLFQHLTQQRFEILQLPPKEHGLYFLQYPDCIQHLLNPAWQKQIYALLNILAKELQEQFGGPFIIISDHGFKDETHSTYGYISSNLQLDPYPKKITDIYFLMANDIDGKLASCIRNDQ